MSQQSERVYAVEGMSCGHCRVAVTEAVGALPGVAAVAVDLAAGTVAVSGAHVSDAAVAGAVREAGYEVRP
jgi:copper chaperone CopZ